MSNYGHVQGAMKSFKGVCKTEFWAPFLHMNVCFLLWFGREEQYHLLIEWKVNLDGLRYTGQQVRAGELMWGADGE